MICENCLEDVDYADTEYVDCDEVYCRWCWPKVKERVNKRNEYHKRIGHTGEDLCGCEMCAMRYELNG